MRGMRKANRIELGKHQSKGGHQTFIISIFILILIMNINSYLTVISGRTKFISYELDTYKKTTQSGDCISLYGGYERSHAYKKDV